MRQEECPGLRLPEALALLKGLDDEYSDDEICRMTAEGFQEYQDCLQIFKRTNGDARATTVEKGRALEEMVAVLFRSAVGLFDMVRNLRTSTNEIDLLLSLNKKGHFLCSYGMINKVFENPFLCECKNYDRKISVTHVGKFFSLLLSTGTKLGLMFSYHGFTGRGWSDSCGLAKKIYMHKERKEDKYALLDFSLLDFEKIASGDNFLSILNRKITDLQFDCDIFRHLSRHPAEE